MKTNIDKPINTEKHSVTNDLTNVLYISVNLNDESKQVLENFFKKHNQWKTNNIRSLCHHMTMAFHTKINDLVLDYTLQNLGKTKELKVIGYGFSEKAFAVLVDTDVPSTNSKKHVTCATNLDNGGKPVDSNSITDWVMLSVEDRFTLSGNITINYKN